MSNIAAIIAKILASVDGYKTILAASILGVTGLLQLLTALKDLGDGGVTVAWPEIQTALVTLGQALAAFGLRKAVSKASLAISGKAV